MPDEKQATLDSPIRPVGPLECLRIPLAPCGGLAAVPIVTPGTRVQCGDRLATAADENGVDIFAPASGLVQEITTVPTLSVVA